MRLLNLQFKLLLDELTVEDRGNCSVFSHTARL